MKAYQITYNGMQLHVLASLKDGLISINYLPKEYFSHEFILTILNKLIDAPTT